MAEENEELEIEEQENGQANPLITGKIAIVLLCVLFIIVGVGLQFWLSSPTINELRTNLTECSDRYEELFTNYTLLKDNFTELEINYTQLGQSYTNLSNDFNDLENDFYNLLNEYDKLENDFNNLEDDYDDLETEYNILEDDFYDLEEDYDEVLENYTYLQENPIVITETETEYKYRDRPLFVGIQSIDTSSNPAKVVGTFSGKLYPHEHLWLAKFNDDFSEIDSQFSLEIFSNGNWEGLVYGVSPGDWVGIVKVNSNDNMYLLTRWKNDKYGPIPMVDSGQILAKMQVG
jgi:hypothetical protein